LRSELGKGSMFDLYIPAQVVEKDISKEEPSAAPAPRVSGERLLLVDDEVGLLAIVKNTLETFGYEVLTASDGLAALEILEKSGGEIDLILTDWEMPFMSGGEFLRRIRGIAPEARIIVITGSGLFEPQDFENLPIKGVLHKPYNTEALLGRIREALDGQERVETTRAAGLNVESREFN
jgi:two-component system, cell cycle sensor histidine kinase and response regulator CckA